MNIPAICDTCSTIFPSGITIEGSAQNIILQNNTVGPCPKCGNNGHTPDGVYNFFNDTMELLSGPLRTMHELDKLSLIIQNAKENKATHGEIASNIEKDLPELSTLKDILPKNRTELYAFLGILLTIIALLLSRTNNKDEKITDVNINLEQVLNVIYQDN